ncbi:2'-deoxycytidine 5'-triphosphate deaminase [Candidatus Woesearchaeota archaeon]|nr:2'-deoxycytidine 5'-triphosphate deaminase [Candidatus Woesearchaeota archaeon]
MNGSCLVSQDLRRRVLKGHIDVPQRNLALKEDLAFADPVLESIVQPSSLDLTIGDEVFVLDLEHQGLFRPSANTTVYRRLLELPRSKRMRYSLEGGFEIKRNFGYLVPVQQKLKVLPEDHMRYSPKSSTGRDFLHSRLLTDFTESFNQINDNGQKKMRDLWLFLNPLAFDLIIGPELGLGQLRIIEGLNAALSQTECCAEFATNPYLKLFHREGYEPTITPEGVQLSLDLHGHSSNNVVALRARPVSTPIDLRKKGAYDPLDFFDPIVTKDRRIVIEPKRHYLMASHEFFMMPSHLNAELIEHSQVGLRGPLHYAGFIDPGFNGQLVFEVTVEENAPLELLHGMPIASMVLFHNDVPDKIYGVSIGSNYADQLGPRVSKRFTALDTRRAAKDHAKLSKPVLVQDAKLLRGLRTRGEGFEFSHSPEEFNTSVESGMEHIRYDCERDPLVLQPIPYVVFFDRDGRVFTYKRAEEEHAYGETRLFGKVSVGVGGHIKSSDYDKQREGCVQRCLERELEEEVHVAGHCVKTKFMGSLFVTDEDVDTVHLGLVYGALIDGHVQPNSKEMQRGAMVPLDVLVTQADRVRDDFEAKALESWTTHLLPHLGEMYKRLQN